MYQIKCDSYTIYDPRDDELFVQNPKCKLAVNTTGEGEYQMVFTTDREEFGGFNRTGEAKVFKTFENPGRGLGFVVTVPSLSALVFEKSAPVKRARKS